MPRRGPGRARPMRVKPRKKSGRPSFAQRIGRITLGDLGQAVSDVREAVPRFLMNVETKRFDTNTGLFAPTNAGIVGPLSILAEGNDYNQRDGLSVRTTAFECRYVWQIDQANALGTLWRVIFFADLENAGAAPAVTDLLEAANPLSRFNHLNLERFCIISDDSGVISLGGSYMAHRHVEVPIHHHLKFSGPGGNTGTQREGALFYLAIDGFYTGAHPSNFELDTRLSYVDN